MQTLPLITSHQGYTLTQVQRGPDWAIYAKTRRQVNAKPFTFEVFQIKVAKPGIAFGKPTPEHEVYPGDNAFGKSAWTVNTIERAHERLKESLNITCNA